MDCVITVKGDGRGNYGHTKQDRTGPIKSFLLDNQVLYTAVLKHVKTCTKCDPVEILKVYLARRVENPKFNGMVSQSLFKQMLKYHNLRSIPDDLFREFVWRQSDIESVIAYQRFLNVKEMVQAVVQTSFSPQGRQFSCVAPKDPKFAAIYEWVLASKMKKLADIPNDLEEIERLITVSEVMGS